jgi:hypothetical protein
MPPPTRRGDDAAAATDGVTVHYAPVYNVTGSGPEIAALRTEMARDKAEIPGTIIKTVRDAKSRRVLA